MSGPADSETLGHLENNGNLLAPFAESANRSCVRSSAHLSKVKKSHTKQVQCDTYLQGWASRTTSPSVDTQVSMQCYRLTEDFRRNELWWKFGWRQRVDQRRVDHFFVNALIILSQRWRMIISQLTMLNMLIAIMGDTFDIIINWSGKEINFVEKFLRRNHQLRQRWNEKHFRRALSEICYKLKNFWSYTRSIRGHEVALILT